MSAVKLESVLAQAACLSPQDQAQLIGALAQGLAQSATPKPQTQTERKAALDSICGKYADVPTSVDDFLARKREEVALEEACYRARPSEEAP